MDKKLRCRKKRGQSRFLEAPLVRQADGELKNLSKTVGLHVLEHLMFWGVFMHTITSNYLSAQLLISFCRT